MSHPRRKIMTIDKNLEKDQVLKIQERKKIRRKDIVHHQAHRVVVHQVQEVHQEKNQLEENQDQDQDHHLEIIVERNKLILPYFFSTITNLHLFYK